MPPQIKQDLNRSGWESTDFPSVCETCLPDNPYVKMLKEDYGAECKLVSNTRDLISSTNTTESISLMQVLTLCIVHSTLYRLQFQRRPSPRP